HAGTAGRMRRRTDLRSTADRLQRRRKPDALGGVLRRARRHQPRRGLQRQTATPPAQPRRRPQPNSALRDRAQPDTLPPETATYYSRVLATGKSKREALRCVKRTLARTSSTRCAPNPTSPSDHERSTSPGATSATLALGKSLGVAAC